MLRYFFLGLGLAGVILGLTACAPNPKSEEPCNFVQNVYGQRVSWKNSLPIPLVVHQDYPKEYLPALERSIKAWHDILGFAPFVIVNTTYRESQRPAKDGRSVVYWLKSWDENLLSEQGRTSIYWIGDQIKEADVMINADPTKFAHHMDSEVPQNSKSVHLESLLIHELGHVLGLKHNDKEESVMATFLAVQLRRDQISESDQASIRCEYK